ncbi:MAG: DEAD/DEAH box helicase [Candidatus Nanopelagicaceae bacterium]
MEALTPAERYAASKSKNKHPKSTSFFESFEFELDDFQVKACYAIEDGNGVLVAAPTGAGKTIVGEFAAYLALANNRKCFYTTPIKALSNQKYQEFVERYGESSVGLLTGDSNINSEADILVMTTEVLRNMLYTGSNSLSNLGFVVMDEVHYLADKFRGAVWEEVLIHLMESAQVVSLSATVSNAEEFGEWLQEVRGKTEVIVSENRPVPLYQHVLIGNRLLDLFNDDGTINQALFRSEREALRRIRTPRNRNDHESRLNRAEVIEKLNSHQMLPAITFIFSRQGCDSAVKQCLAANLKLTNADEKEEIRRTAARYLENLNPDDLEILGYREWLSALERGIAAHHAGLLPIFKGCIEELFQRGLLKAIFATETLALGINMPARTVFLEKLSKWNGENHVPITPGEYTQLTGRAGRRGIDIEGNAVILWSPTVDSAAAAGLAATRTYPLRSSFSPTYNMSINLLERYGRERARNSLKSSFAQFQADRAVVGLDKQIRRNQEAIDSYKTESLCHLGNFAEYAKLRREIKQAETLLSKRSRIDNRQRAHLESELAQYRKSMRQHPCHSCNDRESHARIAERADRLIRENDGLLARVDSRTNVIAKTFDRITEVLNQLEYLSGDQVTESGKMLSKIYAESDLSIAESIKSGILNKLTDIEIASVLSIFIYESRKPEPPKIPNSNVQEALSEIVAIWSKLHNLESEYQLKTQREPDFGLCWIIFRWGGGHGLNSILRNSDLSVGDFVRAVKQLIDLLNQVGIAHPALREKCHTAIKKLDRGVVVYMGGIA